ncbi:Por secretion system C-terminal sorting domain-containing protein [Chryseobacterium oleae]|uniref:Por secretion system C-terminal sorting domain-containing protein n=1 Tax=Chryseobacterium oleae TaxID=491207 RepID=A0A1I5BEV4_CHROL|nr:zinc-dependent metalloprotease family protein [Chryseobacterium oleae]SFN73041.1 Por secretion system C-terminal sorting domain-containing protein [Chryseobacterium oleae]
MKKRILLVCALAGSLASLNAQRWSPASQKTSEIRKEVEVQYSYKVDLSSLRDLLKDAVETGKGAKSVVVSLPTVEGKIEKFAVYSDPVVVQSLADRYQLGSYVGVGVDDPSKYIRFSVAPTEMQSMIIKDGVFQFIEPISTDKQTYGVFYKTKRTASDHGFECSTEEKEIIKDIKSLEANGKKNLSNVGITHRAPITKYRTYRLALSTTGEYTKKFDPAGGIVNTLVQMNATMTRVNGIFEKEFGIKAIIQDLPGIIFLDPAADPYTNNLNLQLQQTLTSQVGNANYDMGHVFHAVGGNGNAGSIGSTCVNPATATSLAKGSAFTQNSDPTGDLFDIDYAAHEMGHQLGANHTFSHVSEGSGVNIEPGGGTTIMGYAGITGDNVQNTTDAYFHYSSINQILNSLDSKTTCGTSETITTNTAPVIAPLTAYSIPKGTAYYLEASATDADAIKYAWEQYDSVDSYNSISGDSGWGYSAQGALTRSYFGTASGRRYFPSLPLVMSGVLTNKTVAGAATTPSWETVSYVPRTLHYAVTVRDENVARPMLSSSETTVTVGNDGPFKFSGLTASSVLYNNASNTITWDVANTNAAPYNAPNVKIEYTTDLVNGATWTELVASTPNTGSYTAQMPASLTGAVKLRVSAIGNVFFAVSPQVTVGTAPTSTTAAPTGVAAIKSEIFKTTARVSWNSVPGATYSINYRKVGTTNWSNATSPTNSVVLNTLEDETNYEVQVAAVVNTVPGAFSSNYAFKTKGLTTGVDYCLMTTGGNSFASFSYNSGLAQMNVANLAFSDLTYKNIFSTYRDYSEDATKVINLTKGTQYTLSYFNVGNGTVTYNDNMEVWIDFNRNGVFEASEKVGSVATVPPASNGQYTGNFTFTVPATAYAGDKLLRMRVANTFFNKATGPCGYPSVPVNGGGVISQGSFKDFSVKITSGLAVDDVSGPKTSEVSIYPNPADTFVEVKNLKGKADYSIFSADGRLVQQGQTDGNNRINVASLIKGMYVITLKDDKNTYNTKLIKK